MFDLIKKKRARACLISFDRTWQSSEQSNQSCERLGNQHVKIFLVNSNRFTQGTTRISVINYQKLTFNKEQQCLEESYLKTQLNRN